VNRAPFRPGMTSHSWSLRYQVNRFMRSITSLRASEARPDHRIGHSCELCVGIQPDLIASRPYRRLGRCHRHAAGLHRQDQAAAPMGNLSSAADNRHTSPHSAPPLMPKQLFSRLSTIKSAQKFRRKYSKPRLLRSLENVRDAWDDFQASRKRDAVYGYLAAVFAIVAHYGVRRRTDRLLRHAFRYAHLPFDKHADPFTAVSRCTCGGVADNKTISKWARALRYGADRYAKIMRRRDRAQKADLRFR
jgi:uncharacterized protein YerC